MKQILRCCLVAALAAGCTQTPPPVQTTALAPAVEPVPQNAIAPPPPALPRINIAPFLAPPPDPAELLGAGPAAVATRLGRPGHVWREDPGAMWQYVTDACVLSVYLHAAEGGLKVIAVQARNRLDASQADPSCYAEFVVGGLSLAAGSS